MPRSLLAPLALLTATVAFAADPKPDPRYELTFEDGSVVVVTVPDAALSVDTKYGRLTVPLAEVRKIDLGFRYPDGVEEKVKKAMEDLGSKDYKTREAGQKALLALGEYAVAVVRAGLTSGVPDTAERCETVLGKLTAALSEEKLNRPTEDVITTPEMVIRGRVASAEFKAKTRYFGDATVKLADLKGFRPLDGRGEETFKLDAAKYAALGWKTFLDTGLEVSKGQEFEVTVSGKIDQWPQTPGQYTSGPGGTAASVGGPDGATLDAPPTPGIGGPGGGFPPGGIPAPGGGPPPGGNPGGLGPATPGGPGPGGGGQAYSSGAVYGRIGAKGELFKIGDKLTQKAPASGKLYLVIAPSNWGNECKGEYEAKVKVGR